MREETPQLHPPRQQRSAETLERILDATEALLERQLFEEISVADIVRRARSSVGSFYARFAGKESLLPHLYARYDRGLDARVDTLLDAKRWCGVGLAGRVEAVVRQTVHAYRSRRGLLRAVVLHARSHPDSAGQLPHARRSRMYDRVADFLLKRRGEIRHPAPDVAVHTGFFFVAAACRDKILFGESPHPASLRLSDERLAEELSRALLAYLTA